MINIDPKKFREIVEIGKNIVPEAIMVVLTFFPFIPWQGYKSSNEKQHATPHHATVADSHTHHEDAQIASKKWAESVSQEALHSHARVR